MVFVSVDDSEDEATASPCSSRGLPQPLDAVRNVPRSANRSQSSRRGDKRDLVSERTPESSLAEDEEELLSPLLREWKSAGDRELGVMSGKEKLLLLLGAAVVGTAAISDPGENVLLDLLRCAEGGGGSSLGIICLYLQAKEERNTSVNKIKKNTFTGYHKKLQFKPRFSFLI